MRSPLASIFRSSTRPKSEPLNILCLTTHESYQTNLARTGHQFYLLNLPGQLTWNTQYRPLPPNVTLLPPNTIPDTINFDLVLSQNKATQFDVCAEIAKGYGLKHIVLEHCTPGTDAPDHYKKSHQSRRGDYNVFISEYSQAEWGWSPEDSLVIPHGIDTEVFKSRHDIRARQILSVVNDYKNRDRECGYRIWENLRANSPALSFLLVGNNPGLSEPAKSVDDLADRYASNWVFLNSSLVSPLPMSILEAMASECVVVSTSTCQIPTVIKHSWNGYISNRVEDLYQYLETIMEDPQDHKEVGKNARQTILGRFSLDKFVENWNNLFREAVNK